LRVQRLTLSDEDKKARDLFVNWLKALKLEITIDEMGNIFGTRPGRARDLPPVMSGSHVDSQPKGGRFDGILGVMGALEVSEKGDLANWTRGDVALAGIGGSLDLAVGAKQVIICMEHTTKNGGYRIVKECQYPLTAKACVNKVITDLAVLEIGSQGVILREYAPGWTIEEIQSLTEPKLVVADDAKEMEF